MFRSIEFFAKTVICACLGGLFFQIVPAQGPDKSKLPAKPAAQAAAGPKVTRIDIEALKKLLKPGGKPLMINFWATWCDPCREEFPDLVKIDADYTAARLNFVAVSLDEVADIKTAVPKFLKEMKAAMPVVLLNVNDPEPAINVVDAAWYAQLPATFLYDKDGHVVFRHFGRIKPDELRAAIDKAVGSKQ